MISLQEKTPCVSNSTAVKNSIDSYAQRDYAGAIATYADDAEVSDATGTCVGSSSHVAAQLEDQLSGREERGHTPGHSLDPWGTIASTEKHVELEMELIADSAGAGSTERECFDLAGLLDQLGVPGPGARRVREPTAGPSVQWL